MTWALAGPYPSAAGPCLRRDSVAQEILAWCQEVSKPFGTSIEIEGDVGVIRL